MKNILKGIGDFVSILVSRLVLSLAIGILSILKFLANFLIGFAIRNPRKFCNL